MTRAGRWGGNTCCRWALIFTRGPDQHSSGCLRQWQLQLYRERNGIGLCGFSDWDRFERYTQGQGQNFYNRNHYVGAYGQDSWQLSPQLTLNYGVRWDVLPPWSEKFNQLLTLDPAEQSAVYPNAPKGISGFRAILGWRGRLLRRGMGMWLPRVAGISWAPQMKDRRMARVLGAPGATVVKAGYAVYYSAFEGLSAGIMSGNPPYGFTDTSAAPTLFDEPFVTAATGVSVGQRFPLQPVAFGASRRQRTELIGELG